MKTTLFLGLLLTNKPNTERKLYGPVGPKIGEITNTSYDAIPINTADPCSLIEVTDSSNAWRTPTKADIEDFVTVGKLSADNWDIYTLDDGTLIAYPDTAVGDMKPHVLYYTDIPTENKRFICVRQHT